MSSSYERAREARIRRNAAKLQQLGLSDELGARGSLTGLSETKLRSVKRRSVKRKRTENLPCRRSARVRKMPPPSYVPPASFAEHERKEIMNEIREQKEKGYRLQSGKWRGEKFGEVKGVPEGRVFGEGDFQRLGRKEMSETGFFRPFVTPEWVEPKGACYSIIVSSSALSVTKSTAAAAHFSRTLPAVQQR